MIHLHYGQPRYPGALQFYHGTISAKGRKDQQIFHKHPIRWWIGLSWAGKWFVGFIRTGPAEDDRQ